MLGLLQHLDGVEEAPRCPHVVPERFFRFHAIWIDLTIKPRFELGKGSVDQPGAIVQLRQRNTRFDEACPLANCGTTRNSKPYDKHDTA